jgi:hypothetical protein
MNKVQRTGTFYSLFPVFAPCFPFYLFYLLGLSMIYTPKTYPTPGVRFSVCSLYACEAASNKLILNYLQAFRAETHSL